MTLVRVGHRDDGNRGLEQAGTWAAWAEGPKSLLRTHLVMSPDTAGGSSVVTHPSKCLVLLLLQEGMNSHSAHFFASQSPNSEFG